MAASIGKLHVEHGTSFRQTNASMSQVVYAFEQLLRVYEATGDHDHGGGPIKGDVGPLAGDCAACNARRVVALLGHSV